MKIDTNNIPPQARLFIKDGDDILFDGLVYEHDNYKSNYKSSCLVRSRLYGMTPIEYDGSTELREEMLFEGILILEAYRDLLIPEACPELPFNKRAKKIFDDGIAEEANRKPIIIGSEL